MKKLMLSVSLVCMVAFVAHANLVKWQFSSTASGSTYKASAADLSGFTAYLLLASDWDQSAASLSKAIGSVALTSQTTTTLARYYTGSTATESTTALSVGDYTSYFYIVVSDGSSYWATSAKDGTVYVAGSTSPITTVSATLSQANAIATSNLASFAPEPASIGLLLLGLCAMGLKRKVA